VSLEKGRTVKSIDHSLWERELADYISLHPDLENLPPPAFPRRRSRLGRRLWLYRHARRARRAARGPRSPVGYMLLIAFLIVETLVLGGIAGWWMGWHL
jgi:hypothetical protein